MRRTDPNTVALCSKGRCCPVVTTLENETIQITDDYDGKVTLTKEEAKMLVDHLSDDENFIHE